MSKLIETYHYAPYAMSTRRACDHIGIGRDVLREHVVMGDIQAIGKGSHNMYRTRDLEALFELRAEGKTKLQLATGRAGA